MHLFSFVVLLCVVMAALTVGVWWKKTNIIELVILGVVYFFCAWILAGMGLFVLDMFRLFRCACATAGLILLSGVGAVLWRRKREAIPWKQLMQVSWNVHDYWIPILIGLCGLALVGIKHGFFGMGQDQGVYQTVAINMMHGLTQRQQDFAEYHRLSGEQQSLFEYYVQNRLYGYDMGSPSYPETVYDLDVSPVSGIYHGIPTFASMLAMWGTLFGMSNMMHVQTVFYVAMIFLTYFVCQNFQLRKSSCALACAAAAASPAVIWVAKSALTEMFLGVIILLVLYFLTDQKHPQRQWMSILPVAVFGCYHVSIYTMIPMFVVLYGGMYWVTRRKCFAVLMPVTLVGYLVSFFAMRHVQPFYTMNNYSPLFGLGISQKELPWLVPLVCAIGIVVCVVFCFVIHRTVHRKYVHLNEEKFLERVKGSRSGFVLVEILLVPLALYMVLRCLTQGDVVDTLRGSTLWSFIACLGVFLLVIAWIVAVLRPLFYLEQTNRLVLLVMMFYCVEFYGSFLRPDVQYFYYYGRYLVPFLPVAAVFGAVTLDFLRAKVTLPVMAAGIVVVAPYDRFLSIQKDDTRMQFSIIEEVAEKIDENDCIIVDGDNMWTLFLPLRAMTGAAVYPPVDDTITLAQQLDQEYDTVYYLGSGEWSSEFTKQFEKVYENTAHMYNDDNVSGRGKWMPFPLSYAETDCEVCLFQYAGEKLEYQASTDAAIRFRGFGSVEQTFCWSNASSAMVRCTLDKRDYSLKLQMGCVMDLQKLGMTEYPVTVACNEIEVGTVIVNAENNGGALTVDIPKEIVQGGQNIITLHCALWDAGEIQPGDTRQLGFPLESLTFTPKA